MKEDNTGTNPQLEALRRHSRHKSRISASIVTLDGDGRPERLLHAFATDISLSGMRLQGAEALPIGKRLRLLVSESPVSKGFEREAIVRNASKLDRWFVMGVEFLKPSGASAKLGWDGLLLALDKQSTG
ncbi:MAG: PilZ domain-containing protein [Planctomycetota bacterium]|nr:PilZ domain-containing protein [Planctomycetota bacterium]